MVHMLSLAILLAACVIIVDVSFSTISQLTEIQCLYSRNPSVNANKPKPINANFMIFLIANPVTNPNRPPPTSGVPAVKIWEVISIIQLVPPGRSYTKIITFKRLINCKSINVTSGSSFMILDPKDIRCCNHHLYCVTIDIADIVDCPNSVVLVIGLAPDCYSVLCLRRHWVNYLCRCLCVDCYFVPDFGRCSIGCHILHGMPVENIRCGNIVGKDCRLNYCHDHI